jgi:hypothetical protein
VDWKQVERNGQDIEKSENGQNSVDGLVARVADDFKQCDQRNGDNQLGHDAGPNDYALVETGVRLSEGGNSPNWIQLYGETVQPLRCAASM